MATTDVDVRIVDDPARAAAEVLAEVSGNVALSGGGTVGRAYELAAELRPNWMDRTIWFGDERAVPPDDERSNYRLARETLLDRLRVQPTIHRIEASSEPKRQRGSTNASSKTSRSISR